MSDKPIGSHGYGVGSDDDPIQHQTIDNPPHVSPPGMADAPPAVPPEPNPDPETQAYLDSFEAPPDPRDAETEPTPEEYLDSFSKPPDPRDPDGSAPPDPPDPPTDAPVNIDVPHVTQTGATLDCTMGNWDHEPASYAYAWYTDDIPNGVATPSFALVSGDEGKGFSCLVTATNAIGSTDAPMSNVVIAV